MSNAVTLLVQAQIVGDAQVFAHCRFFIVQRADAVRHAGGMNQLRNLSLAKVILGDVIERAEQCATQRTKQLERINKQLALQLELRTKQLAQERARNITVKAVS